MSIHSPADISQLGTIMFVGAHPDDETFLCGGILAAARQAGQRVVCITATHGEAGIQNEAKWPAATIAQVRTKELEAALQAIGVDEHHWLAYKDGGCEAANKDEAVQAIASLMAGCRPDTILTFGPDGLTGHPDHQAVSRWTKEAAKAARSEAKLFYKVEAEELYEPYLQPMDKAADVYFMTEKPPLKPLADCDICFELSSGLWQRKLKALQAMPSQTEGLLRAFPEAFLQGAFHYETFVRASSDPE